MADMLVLVPSRERPANLARFTAAAQDTLGGAADLMFVLDEDDPLLEDAIAVATENRILTRVQPRMLTVPKLNAAALAYCGAYPVIMFTGDDTVPRSRWWDADIVSAMSDLVTGYVYPNGLGRTDIPEHVAISTDIIRALGWFGLPSIRHYYVDEAWADLGNGAQCITYLPDVVVEHLNPLYGKGPRDHIVRLGEWHADADRQALEAWRADGLEADLKTVRSLL